VTETPEAATSRIFDINYHGCVRLVGAAAPAMMAAGRGLIVNMGSASAYSGGAGARCYSSTITK
jgi:short-subunit dehydrogenase